MYLIIILQLQFSITPFVISTGIPIETNTFIFAGAQTLELRSFRALGQLSYQLLFHVWRTSVSYMPCLSACSSRKSNMYLMASGRALPRCAVLKMVSKRSSTNFCRVPCKRKKKEKNPNKLYYSYSTFPTAVAVTKRYTEHLTYLLLRTL